MRNLRTPMALIFGIGLFWLVANPAGVAADRGREKVILEDDCDPDDPAWGENGCLRDEGSVSRAEFAFYSNTANPAIPPAGTPLAMAVIGHPSWRNDPGYLLLSFREKLRVRNAGGRGHTFTKVDDFGGGFVAPLNFGLAQSPQCAAIASDPTQIVAPGARREVPRLAPGTHKFQCCIHPWMRTLVKVQENDE